MPHVSTLKLNQYRYGELEGPALDEIQSHLAECERCSQRLGAQQNNRAAFELEPVPQAIQAAANVPAAANQPSRWLTWVGGAVFAAAAVLLVIPAAQELDTLPTAPSISDGTQTKGAGDDLEVWIDTPTGPAQVKDGGRVHPGDRLQLRYRRPPSDWVTLAGTDAQGTIEIYGSWQASRDESGWQKAPFALGLDDTPGVQKFHAVYTDTQPQPQAVKQMLSHGAVPKPNQIDTVMVENKP